MTRPVYKFKHLDRLNSPNSVQFIRLLQKSQVSKSLQVLFFQNLTKPFIYGHSVTFSLTNAEFFGSCQAYFFKKSCTKIAFGKTFKQPRAKVVPICRTVTPSLNPHVENLPSFEAPENNEKPVLKLPDSRCLYSTFALRFDITLSRRKLTVC